MQGAYVRLVVVIMYSVNSASRDEEFSLVTQNDLFILTEASQRILVTE